MRLGSEVESGPSAVEWRPSFANRQLMAQVAFSWAIGVLVALPAVLGRVEDPGLTSWIAFAALEVAFIGVPIAVVLLSKIELTVTEVRLTNGVGRVRRVPREQIAAVRTPGRLGSKVSLLDGRAKPVAQFHSALWTAAQLQALAQALGVPLQAAQLPITTRLGLSGRLWPCSEARESVA